MINESSNKRKVSITLDDNLAETYVVLAEEEHRSLSNMIEVAMREYLEWRIHGNPN